MNLKMGRLLALCLAAGCQLAVAAGAPDFPALLDESQLVFQPPAQSTAVALKPNPVFTYEKALRTADGRLEIRYAVRPLGRPDVRVAGQPAVGWGLCTE